MTIDSDPSSTPAPTAPVKTKLPIEQSLVLGILGAKERGKKQYANAKGYLEKLRAIVKVGKTVELADGRKFKLVDTFAGDVDSVKKMTFIDRFELQAVK